MVRIRRACVVESLALVNGAGVEGAGETEEAVARLGIGRGCKVEDERRGRVEGPGVGVSSGAGGATGGGGGTSFSCWLGLQNTLVALLESNAAYLRCQPALLEAQLVRSLDRSFCCAPIVWTQNVIEDALL